MEPTANLPDYKSNTKEELRELCIERKIHTVRREYSKETCTKALRVYDRRVAGITVPTYALDYKSWRKEDLRIFCVQRGIYPESRRLLEQSTYIKALKASDRQARFRFLDLPPELRTMVYSELFADEIVDNFDKRGGMKIVRYPQILRVSKLCYREASDVLDQQSSLIIETFKLPGIKLYISGDIKLKVVPKPKTESQIAAQFAKFSTLKNVIIRLRSYAIAGTMYFGLEYTLPALFSVFDSGNALKVLTLEFNYPSLQTGKRKSRRTVQEMASFETALRASTMLKGLPTATRLILLGFETLNLDEMTTMLEPRVPNR